MGHHELPLPSHFDPGKMGQIWKIPYQERAEQARAWAREHRISPAADDAYRICLVAVDVQNTFCLPGGHPRSRRLHRPADAAFKRFAEAGMNVVRSTDPLHGWPGIQL